eukprot:479139-Pleurochrysis_carterae.AAC.2
MLSSLEPCSRKFLRIILQGPPRAKRLFPVPGRWFGSCAFHFPSLSRAHFLSLERAPFLSLDWAQGACD